MDVHSDLLLNVSLIFQVKFEHIAMKINISSAANYLTMDTIWFDLI